MTRRAPLPGSPDWDEGIHGEPEYAVVPGDEFETFWVITQNGRPIITVPDWPTADAYRKELAAGHLILRPRDCGCKLPDEICDLCRDMPTLHGELP